MTSACFSRGHTGFSRNATLVATVNPPALAGGVFNQQVEKAKLSVKQSLDKLETLKKSLMQEYFG